MENKMIPISYEDWDTSKGRVIYCGCIFTENFDEYVKGDEFPWVIIDYLIGTIEIYKDLSGDVIKTLNFKIELI